MCQMASFIVTKKKVYWSEKTDSHEDIIQEFKLKERDVRGNYLFVRVEISPPDRDYKLPLSKWKFYLDQDLKPDWYDKKTVERRTRTALKAWYKACVIPAGKTVSELTSCIKILLGTVDKLSLGGVVDEVYSGGVVKKVCGGIVRSVLDGGLVGLVRSGGIVQEVLDGGLVGSVRSGGIVQEVFDGGIVRSVLDGGLVQEVLDGGIVRSVRDGGLVGSVRNGGTVQEVLGGGIVITYTKNLTPKILKNASAVLIDRSGKTVVCYTGENK